MTRLWQLADMCCEQSVGRVFRRFRSEFSYDKFVVPLKILSHSVNHDPRP